MKTFSSIALASVLSFVGTAPCIQAATTSFDFLNIPATARQASSAGSLGSDRDSMEGLWQNPASLAGLSNRLHLTLSYNNHLGMSLISGGLASSKDHWVFGASVAGLSYGLVTGDIQNYGDLGRSLATGSVLVGGNAAWQIGASAGWKIGLDLGLGLKYASETLDTTKIGALLADGGVILGVPISSRFDLNVGFMAQNIAISTSGAPSLTVPLTFSPALSLTWNPAAAVQGRLMAQGQGRSGEDFGASVATEWRLAKIFNLRAAYRFGQMAGFSFGGGVSFTFPGPNQLALDMAQGLDGNSAGGTVVQVTGAFGQPN